MPLDPAGLSLAIDKMYPPFPYSPTQQTLTPNELLLLRLFRCLSPGDQAIVSMNLATKVVEAVFDEDLSEDRNEYLDEFVGSKMPGMPPRDSFDVGIHDALESTWPDGLSHGIFFGDADDDDVAAETLLAEGSAYPETHGFDCYATVEECYMFIQSWRERVIRCLEMLSEKVSSS